MNRNRFYFGILLLMSLMISGCSKGELISSHNTRMTVTSASGDYYNLSITLIDELGYAYINQQIGNKWCYHGPDNLPVGKELIARVDTYWDNDKKIAYRYVDRDDLIKRFCNK